MKIHEHIRVYFIFFHNLKCNTSELRKETRDCTLIYIQPALPFQLRLKHHVLSSFPSLYIIKHADAKGPKNGNNVRYFR